jgi:cytoskeleton protein RodZ
VADKKSKSKPQAADAGRGAESGPSLGQIITQTRERKGMTREQVIAEAHLPAHYVKMIEDDDYELISDRLYLVPFLRRYATFLGLDAEEIASRFVSNVQHAEANVVRISQEIKVVAKKPGAARRIAFAVMIAAVVILLADFAYRRFAEHEAAAPATVASPAASASESSSKAPNASLPPVTIVTNPEAAAPPAQPAAASAQPIPQAPGRPASVPPAANRTVPQRPVPRAATDN